MRPICPACNQRPRAINCYKNDKLYYRSRCEICIRKNKKIKAPEPKWRIAGYKKKPHCDRCGFKAKHFTQLLVYHIDNNLNNVQLSNLRTICLNCVEDVKRLPVPWAPNPLQADH